jgi:hypothetical protein
MYQNEAKRAKRRRLAMKKSEPDVAWTMSVPEAGKKYLDAGERASYRAADRGLLPTIQVGGKRRVLVRVLEQRLLDDPKA